uniref:Uncharacterized protein n=1 Tax=Oryza meridionalis TaxID=40149 RepID=A0A0E0F6J5_9ORYZ
MPRLKRMEIQQGSMARLQQLYLVNLSSMTEVPPGIEFLMSTLKSLDFAEITQQFLATLQARGRRSRRSRSRAPRSRARRRRRPAGVVRKHGNTDGSPCAIGTTGRRRSTTTPALILPSTPRTTAPLRSKFTRGGGGGRRPTVAGAGGGCSPLTDKSELNSEGQGPSRKLRRFSTEFGFGYLASIQPVNDQSTDND